MQMKRRLLNFESCSVALFTSLALSGFALQARADDSAKKPPSSSSSAQSSAPSPFTAGPTRSEMGAAPAGGSTASQKITFQKADANGDGKVSRQEAGAVPGLVTRFDKLDTNKDGSLSSAEYDATPK
jgi:hypothetical protein